MSETAPRRYSFTRDDLLEAIRYHLDGDTKRALFLAGFDAPSLTDAIIGALGAPQARRRRAEELCAPLREASDSDLRDALIILGAGFPEAAPCRTDPERGHLMTPEEWAGTGEDQDEWHA